MRNEEECVCSVCLFRCNIFIGFRIIKEMPGLVGSGTPYITQTTTKIWFLHKASPLCSIYMLVNKISIIQVYAQLCLYLTKICCWW